MKNAAALNLLIKCISLTLLANQALTVSTAMADGCTFNSYSMRSGADIVTNTVSNSIPNAAYPGFVALNGHPVNLPAGILAAFPTIVNGGDGDTGNAGTDGQQGSDILVQNCGNLSFQDRLDPPYYAGLPGYLNSAINALSFGGTGGKGADSNYDHVSHIGGNGGAGGNINIDHVSPGSISVSVDDVAGIYAYSLGGNGGNGGSGASIWHPDGSDGGLGGNGGSISINNSAGIVTSGARSPAIKARSEGGASGNGGAADSCTVCFFGQGGSGGTAGNSGLSVAVNNGGNINTSGNGSTAILMQSIGGNGGAGGNDHSLLYAVGGNGGAGGNGGSVNVDHTGAINTSGNHAIGISGFSIGGGGGDGGDAHDGSIEAGVALGGSAGGGGDAGFVQLITEQGSSIKTSGRHAPGMLGSSIGGGGGYGGAADGITIGAFAAFQASIGGSGGKGGNAGEVNIVTGSGATILTGENPTTAINPGIDSLPGDHSPGILAQAIGGGGGVGGNAVAISAAAGDKASLNATVAIGGSGNAAGNGGGVQVDTDASIRTMGRMADGIYASSVGGGGGHGGHSFAGGISGSQLAGSINVGIGGSGASGGNGSWVNVVYSGAINTYSSKSNGILAQSIGGGGGTGGSVTDVAGSVGNKSLAIDVGVGGSGGAGGGGGGVDVTLSSNRLVATAGHNSRGVVAQSIGGGGGDGGSVHTYAVALGRGSGKAGAVSVGVGGSGSGGGVGGTVTLKNSASIITTGDHAQALLGQSIGGGGGTGGNVQAISVAASLDPTVFAASGSAGQNFSSAVSVGGSGGNGSTSSTVSVDNRDNANIQTYGIHSSAILAQSIGGGGGVGGNAHSFAVSTNIPVSAERIFVPITQFAQKFTDSSNGSNFQNQNQPTNPSSLAATVSVGGSAGTGGDAAGVTVTHESNGAIETSGNHSHGIHAQSVGGGGGVGGEAYGDGLAGVDSYGLGVSVGGKGGAGGNGGAIDYSSVESAGLISTKGDFSHGVFAQSIGGGGGLGGAATANFYTIKGLSKKAFQIDIGGAGNAAGQGGIVNIKQLSGINTYGAGSSAIFAQSIGGGGGSGAASIGHGMFDFGLGGSGSAGADGGSVTIDGVSDLSTLGDAAPVILAQSVGGGGGHGGVSSGSKMLGLASVGLKVNLGGSGSGGGNGGAVNVTRGGHITSTGLVSPGIIAQSVGGGGGIAGGGSVTLLAGDIKELGVSGSNGVGGAVTIQDTSSNPMQILTSGDGAHGMVGQTVSGGGGLVLLPTHSDNLNTTFGTFAQSSSDGDVAIELNGSIKTSGNHAYGILGMNRINSMAILDPAGLTLIEKEGSNSSNTSEVKVSLERGATMTTSGVGAHGIYTVAGLEDIIVDGTISVTGRDAWAISTHSDTPAVMPPSSTTTIHVGGVVVAGENARGAIDVHAGGGATVNIYGTVSGNTAIQINDPGKTTINVGGSRGPAKIFGDIKGLDNVNPIPITQNGWTTISGGDTDSLSTNNATHITVKNQGGTIWGSVSGGDIDYVFANNARHILNVNPNEDYPDESDSLVLSGIYNSDGSGVVIPYLTQLPTYRPSVVTLISLNNKQDYLDGLGLMSHGTLATEFYYIYGRDFVGLNRVDIDFSRAYGLSQNDMQLAKLANAQLFTEDAQYDKALKKILLNAANATTLHELSKGLEALNADSHFANTQSTMESVSSYAGEMQSCGDYTSSYAAIAQANCNWAKYSYREYQRRGGAHLQAGNFFTFGRQQEVADHYYLGFSAGFEDSSFRSSTATSLGYRGHIGTIVKYQNGPYIGTASLGASYGSYVGNRRVAEGAADLTAQSDQQTASVSSRLSAGYMIKTGPVDVIPRFDIDLAMVHDFGYREKGAGALNMQVHSDSHFLADLHPALRINKSFQFQEINFQAFVEGGARFSLNDSSLKVSLANTANSDYQINLNSNRDDVIGTVATGLNFTPTKDLEIRLIYEGGFSNQTQNTAGGVKVGYKF